MMLEPPARGRDAARLKFRSGSETAAVGWPRGVGGGGTTAGVRLCLV
jgi:hypothetical protein